MILFPVALVASAITSILNLTGPEMVNSYVIREWDGTLDVVKATWVASERAYVMVYADGTTHVVSEDVFEGMYVADLDPRVIPF
jgi:hypothetical protein